MKYTLVILLSVLIVACNETDDENSFDTNNQWSGAGGILVYGN
jgi:hypothetical protein